MSPEQPKRDCFSNNASSFIWNINRLIMYAVLALVIALAASCGGSGTASNVTTPPASGWITTSSGALFPAFTAKVSDYGYLPSSAGPLVLKVAPPPGTSVSIDGQPPLTQTFTQSVNISAGQSFQIAVTSALSTNIYYVRCLPSDFPTWTMTTTSASQVAYYAIAPDIALDTNGPPTRLYMILADGNGAPIWWYRAASQPRNALVLSNGNIAWTTPTTVEEHTLTGATVRSFGPDVAVGGVLDLHELQQLPNGDYIIIADVNRGPVDLTAENGLASAMVTDNVIEEIAPNGSLVWHWSAMDHVSPTQTFPIWWPQYIQGQTVADPYHMNSVDPNGTGFIVSFRHMNAVYRIDKASGNILWKVGGTSIPGSLTFSADTYGNWGGQHDARMLPDGTLTVHDNGTMLGRSPRAVRYNINTAAGTATLMESVVDPSIPSSLCCGSARKLPGGDWGITWGINPVVTETTAAGAPVFRMTFNQPYFTYRALPVPTGMLSA